MRNRKIVADSSANLMKLQTAAFDAAPLKIMTAERGGMLVGYEKF